MVTGHVQRLANQLLECTRTGRMDSLQSLRIFGSFGTGVAFGAAAPRIVPAPFRRLPAFVCMGAAYAVLLVLSEWPMRPARLWRALREAVIGGPDAAGIDDPDLCDFDDYETTCR